MSDILARTPFLKIIIPAAAGIAMSRLISIPVWLAIMCCIVSVVMAVALYKRISGQVYVWFSFLLFFFAMAGISSPRSRLPQGKRIAVAVQICERPDVRGRWQYTTADVGYYR